MAARRAVLFSIVVGAWGCDEPPGRLPIFAPDGSMPFDAGRDGGAGSPGDAGSHTPFDGGTRPGAGTWIACVPTTTNRICYAVPASLAMGGVATTYEARIAVTDDTTNGNTIVTDFGSVPPFRLEIRGTSVGEHITVSGTTAGSGDAFALTFPMPEQGLYFVESCNATARRYRVLRSGASTLALEFEFDCTNGSRLRGAILSESAFTSFRDDPIDGL